MLNKIHKGSCFYLIKKLPDNYIDLIITSPPYADTKFYGEKVNVFHPDNYVSWIINLFQSSYRVLKNSGSFIFNIDDKCVNKLRHPYIFDLILSVINYTDLKLYDYYFWYKKSHLPNGNSKRLNHSTEWILHFCKDQNKIKWNMDEVREPYAQSSLNRIKTPIKDYKIDKNGIKIGSEQKQKKLNKKGKIPNNIFRFQNNQVERGNKHPAPFNKELPIWFIKALTDENDIVLDPFMGSGTTAIAAIELKRNWIGFEINSEYIKLAEQKIKNLTGVERFFN